MRIKRKAFRRRGDIPHTEAFTVMSKAEEKGRKAIRRVILNKR